MKSKSFERLAGWFAIFTAVFGLLYSVSFVILQNNLFSALFLMLGGLLTTLVMTELYQKLREVDASYALWAFILSAGAAVGSLIHGGYDLSNALHPPAVLNMDLPSQIDPRGLLTFGAAGIGLFFLSWLMVQSQVFTTGLGYLGYVSAILMVILYLARLIILAATNPAVIVPALLEGFIVNPIWYFWLGIMFLRRK